VRAPRSASLDPVPARLLLVSLLASQLASLLAAAAALAPAAAGAAPAPTPVSAPVPTPVTAPAPAVWGSPLGDPPEVTRPFTPAPSPYGPGHRGADLAGAPGDAVRAAGDGVVAFAGMVAGRPVVSVDHAGGLRTTYEPVTPSVAAGQEVRRGEALGTLAGGHAGCPVAACVHWGLRRGEVYLDPLSLLRPPGVRLLPLDG
jgi:murein DD-endopeptidase MepM/ murein hydrolase activator NlpD